MIKIKDLEIMIEAFDMTLAIHEREERFFKRSAHASSSQEVKDTFLEMAKEMHGHLVGFIDKRNKLKERLESLQKNR
jgi:hypothetical protein